MRSARRIFLRRLVLPLVVFGVAHVWIAARWGEEIREWTVGRGERAGGSVFRSGPYFVGERGPFLGDSGVDRRWNFLYRNLAWAAAAAGGFCAAAAVFTIESTLLGCTRPFGYRGPTRCGGCGYMLAGLCEPCCPECGQRI